MVIKALTAVLLAVCSMPAAQPVFDRSIVDRHRQVYGNSCVPSAFEMVLKLTGRVPVEYFELQDVWQNKSDGSGRDFDNVAIAGLTFHQLYAQPRKRGFPFAGLFAAIDAELDAGRYVITGLRSGKNTFHAWVIVERLPNGEYRAVSKSGADTIEVTNTRAIIRKMKGTDIVIYRSTSGATLTSGGDARH
jgi:hypothetical protein